MSPSLTSLVDLLMMFSSILLLSGECPEDTPAGVRHSLLRGSIRANAIRRVVHIEDY